MTSIHPLSRTLYRFVTFLSTWCKCKNKGSGTINDYKDKVGFTSNVNISMVPSPEASHLAALNWRRLLDAMLTTLKKIIIELMDVP